MLLFDDSNIDFPVTAKTQRKLAVAMEDPTAANEIISALVAGNRQGFLHYEDAASTVTPLTLDSNVWTTLINDGAGPGTNEENGPGGIRNLIDTTTGDIRLDRLTTGDIVFAYQTIRVTPSVNGAVLNMRYESSGGGGFQKTLGILLDGAGIEYSLQTTDCLTVTSVAEDPVKFELKLSEDGTVTQVISTFHIFRAL